MHRLPHRSRPGTVPLSIGQGKPTGGVGAVEPTLHRLATHFPAAAPIPLQTRGLTARQPQQITAPTGPHRRTWARTPSSSIGPRPPGFGHARADHDRGNVVVSEDLLDRADVVDRREQAGDTSDDSPSPAPVSKDATDAQHVEQHERHHEDQVARPATLGSSRSIVPCASRRPCIENAPRPALTMPVDRV